MDTHVQPLQGSRNTALTKVIFVASSVLPTTQMPLRHEKRCHETIILTVGLKAGEKKTLITVLSLAPRMAMPPYASAKACVILSVAKSAVSDMQVAATWLGCLVMEFASLHLPSQATGTSMLSFLQFLFPPHFFKFPSSTK